VTSFQQAVDNQILDGHRSTAAAKLQGLDEMFEFCRKIALNLAADGQMTIGANGAVWWSHIHERIWAAQGRVPNRDELPERWLASWERKQLRGAGRRTTRIRAT